MSEDGTKSSAELTIARTRATRTRSLRQEHLIRIFRSRERVQKRIRNAPNRLTPRDSRGTPHLLSP